MSPGRAIHPIYHWSLGRVVDNIEPELIQALGQAFTTHHNYMEKQREAFAYTFYTEPGSTAAERGAKAIADFLNARSCQMGIFPVTSYDGFGPG